MRSAKLWLGFALFALVVLGLRAQDASVSVTVKISATATASGGQTGTLQLSAGFPSGSFEESGSGSGTISLSPGTVKVQTGYVYILTASYQSLASLQVNAMAARGYQVLFNNMPRDAVSLNNPGTGETMISFCVLGRDRLSGRAGTCTSFASGQVKWQVALGGLKDGGTAGALALVDPGSEASWSGLYTTAVLHYMSLSAEVQTYNDANGNLRQIMADQAFVDIVTLSSPTSFEIRFYPPSEVQGSNFPYTFSGLPYVTYRVQAPTGSSGNQLEIISITHPASGLSGTTLSSSAPDTATPIARTATTTLSQTGTSSSNYVWTVQDWTTSGSTALIQHERSNVSNGSGRTETRTVSPPSGSVVLQTTNSYVTENWGEEIYTSQKGTSNPITTTYTYDTNTADGGYGLASGITATDGSWKSFAYQPLSNGNNWAGVIYQISKPFGNSTSGSPSSGQVTTYGFALDAFQMPTRLNSLTVAINGSTFGSETVTYSTPTSVNGCTIVQAVALKTPASGPAVTTTGKYFQEDSPDDFFRSQPYSAIAADGSMTAYAYERGNYSAGSFTPNTSGTGSLVAVISGSANSSSGGSGCTSYNGATTDTIYLISGKSTASVSYRDATAQVQRTEQYAWMGTAWQLIGYTNFTYDLAGCLIGSSSSNNAATSSTFSGEQKLSDVDATGSEVDYTYDVAGRLATATKKITGLCSNYSYDAAGHVLSEWLSNGTSLTESAAVSTYDLAGRVTQGASPGLGTVSFSYSYSGIGGGSGWQKTSTYAYDNLGDTATRTETYQNDGRLASLSGSGVIAKTFAYSFPTGADGNLATTSTVGSSRTSTIVTDWFGRKVSVSEAAYAGSTLNETDSYDSNSHLTEVQTTGLAPTLYQYDAMGNVILSGLDVNNDNLNPASTDRITGSSSYVEYYQSNYWLHKESDAYPVANSATEVTTIVRTRLTGFPANCTAETLTTDAYNNVTDQVTSVVPNSGGNPCGNVEVATTKPGCAHQVSENYTAGLKMSSTAEDGTTTTWTYDGLERMSNVTDNRGYTTTYAYAAGSGGAATAQVQSVTDPLDGTCTYAYDPLGRTVQTTRADGTIINTAYNAQGLLVAKWGTGMSPVSYSYDSTTGDRLSISTYCSAGSGALSSSTWSPGSCGTADTTTFVYDAGSGLLTSRTDAVGHTVQYTYTTQGKVSTRAWAQNGTTTYAYDPNTADLLSVTYSNTSSPTTNLTYTYNRMGRMASVVDATGTRTMIYGSASGAPGTELDRVQLDPTYYNGRILTRLYDSDGSLPGRPTGFSLGNSSNPAADLTQSYAYNGNYDVSSVTSTAAGASGQFNYSYVANSSLVGGVSLQGSSNYSTEITYDARNMVSSVEGSNAAGVQTEFTYTYNARGQRVSAAQQGAAFQDYWQGESYSGVYNSYQYDGFGDLTTAQMATGTTPGSGTALPGRVFAYSFDTAQNRESAGEHGSAAAGDNSYTTNSLNQYTGRENLSVRVLGDTTPGATVSVAGAVIAQTDRNFGGDFFPANGPNTLNPNASNTAVSGSLSVTSTLSGGTTKSASVPYLVPAQQQSFTYDQDGNLTGDGVWTYSFDGENRLVSMTSSLLNETLNFKYDYRGRRAEKQVLIGSTVTWDRKLIYDGNNLVAEVDAMSDSTQNDVLRSYTWGLDVTGSFKKAGGVGALLEVRNYQYSGSTQTSTSYFPTYDGNGNVVSLIRGDGTLAVTYEYSPYGELLRNVVNDTAVADNPIRFSTKYEDKESELLYYGARFFSPSLGRFINRDSGKGSGHNLYAFTRNDGINHWDVLGHNIGGSDMASISAGPSAGTETVHYDDGSSAVLSTSTVNQMTQIAYEYAGRGDGGGNGGASDGGSLAGVAGLYDAGPTEWVDTNFAVVDGGMAIGAFDPASPGTGDNSGGSSGNDTGGNSSSSASAPAAPTAPAAPATSPTTSGTSTESQTSDGGSGNEPNNNPAPASQTGNTPSASPLTDSGANTGPQTTGENDGSTAAQVADTTTAAPASNPQAPNSTTTAAAAGMVTTVGAADTTAEGFSGFLQGVGKFVTSVVGDVAAVGGLLVDGLIASYNEPAVVVYNATPPPVPADPSQPPADGWEWKGNGPPGSSQGSWVNPDTGETLHPDLDHPDPVGPHWDWTDANGNQYRIPPGGGTPIPKG